MHHAPCTMHHAPKKSFLTSETGAVTVDWVVLTAAVVGLGIATAGVVQTGLQASSGTLSGNIGASVASQSGGEGGFIQWAAEQALLNPGSALVALGGQIPAAGIIQSLDSSFDISKPVLFSSEVTFTDANTNGNLFTMVDDSTNERLGLAGGSAGNLRIYKVNADGTSSTINLTDVYSAGETANISMSYDNTTGEVSVYKGTERIGGGTFDQFASGSSPSGVTIGEHPLGGGQWQGTMSEVVVTQP